MGFSAPHKHMQEEKATLLCSTAHVSLQERMWPFPLRKEHLCVMRDILWQSQSGEYRRPYLRITITWAGLLVYGMLYLDFANVRLALMLSTGLWNEVRSHSSSRPVELKSRIFNFTEVISDKKIHCIKSQVQDLNLCHEIWAAQHTAVTVSCRIYTNWRLQYKLNVYCILKDLLFKICT